MLTAEGRPAVHARHEAPAAQARERRDITRNDVVEQIDVLPSLIHGGRCVVADPRVEPPPGSVRKRNGRVFIVVAGARTMCFGRDGTVVQDTLRTGDMFLCRRDSWHRPIWNQHYVHFSINFSPTPIEFGWNGEGQEPPIQRRVWECEMGQDASVHHVITALDHLGPGEEEAARGLVEALVHLLRTQVTADSISHSGAEATLRAIRRYLEANFHLPINRDAVADQFRLHPNHISRLFRELTGESFFAYLNGLRMDRARELLCERVLSVKEVASECGFESANYFCKAFRKVYGCSPGRYVEEGP